MACFVPGCKTGYESQKKQYKQWGIKNPSRFRARTKDMLNDWRNAIARIDKYMTKNDFICERHFKPEEIEREYTHKMPDGSMCHIQKGKPTLKPGVVPSIFLDCMENTRLYGETLHSTKKQNLYVSTVHRDDAVDCAMAEKDTLLQPALVIDHSMESESPNDASVCAKPQTVLYKIDCTFDKEVSDVQRDDLVHNNKFEHIPLPSPFWTLSTVNGVGIFSYWTEDLHSIAKRVLVHQDLNLVIFINERPVSIAGMERVESTKDIAHVLTKLTKILPCPGASNEQRATNCSGYIPCKSKHVGPQTRRCAACRKKRKDLHNYRRKIQPLQK